VTRNVTSIVNTATRRMVVARGVVQDIGERTVKMNVALNYEIASIVKLKMESAASVNQDFGVTTVERNVVLGVQANARRGTEIVRHA